MKNIFSIFFFCIYFFYKVEYRLFSCNKFGGGHTFGIFVLHQAPILYCGKYNVWIDFWKVDKFFDSYYFVPYCFVVLFFTFLFSLIIDMIINILIKKIFRIKEIQKIFEVINHYIDR